MSTHLSSPSLGESGQQRFGLRVTRYDQVASILIALLILMGVSLVTLLIMWFSSKVFVRTAVVPVQVQEVGGGGLGEEFELEPPTIEGSDPDAPELEETLAAVADAVGTKLATLDAPTFTGRSVAGHGSVGSGRLGRRGPRSDRNWEVRFGEGYTLDVYARQLDFFGIELGALSPGGNVEYVSKLSQSTPTRRTGNAKDEKRYYLTWRRGALQEADRDLLGRAGISPEGKMILKFLTPQVEATLIDLEKRHAGNRANDVRGTRYSIRPQGTGWTFQVESQWYWHLND